MGPASRTMQQQQQQVQHQQLQQQVRAAAGAARFAVAAPSANAAIRATVANLNAAPMPATRFVGLIGVQNMY